MRVIELQERLADPNSKEELVQKLLRKHEQQQSKALRGPTAERGERAGQSSRQEEAQEDPTNPEFEQDFKKAYHKLTERLDQEDENEEVAKILLTDRDRDNVKAERQVNKRLIA